MRIACVGYRQWSLNIYIRLKDRFPDFNFLVQSSEREYNERDIFAFDPDLVLFYGWSRIIGGDLLTSHTCLMLHPSPLPKYRGGSPIQNQIIRGESDSAVTIFSMDDGVDTGPILKQRYMTLEGTISEIFERIEEIGFEMTCEILLDGIEFQEQDHSQATQYSRLTPDRSELTIDELMESSGHYLFNKIRMLQDPYPNAFIRTKDGRKLLIKSAVLEDE